MRLTLIGNRLTSTAGAAEGGGHGRIQRTTDWAAAASARPSSAVLIVTAVTNLLESCHLRRCGASLVFLPLRTQPSGWPRAWVRWTFRVVVEPVELHHFIAEIGKSHRQWVDRGKFLLKGYDDILRIRPLHRATSAFPTFSSDLPTGCRHLTPRNSGISGTRPRRRP